MWWMSGDIHDFQFPDEPLLYPQRSVEAGHMMEASIWFLCVYYLIVKPSAVFQPSHEADAEYDDTGLKPRFSFFFKTWREYENVQ